MGLMSFLADVLLVLALVGLVSLLFLLMGPFQLLYLHRRLRQAGQAREAAMLLLMIWRASVGFSSKNSASFAFTDDSTSPAIAGLPSFVFVWPSNCGF